LFLFELQLGHHCDPHHDTVKIYCPKVHPLFWSYLL
jgi:hypothetical protein